MRHEMNKIQRKVHNIWTYGINTVSLPCCNYKKCIPEDG